MSTGEIFTEIGVVTILSVTDILSKGEVFEIPHKKLISEDVKLFKSTDFVLIEEVSKILLSLTSSKNFDNWSNLVFSSIGLELNEVGVDGTPSDLYQV